MRIPKLLIEEAGLGRTVELRVEGDRVVISPHRRPRQGWEEAFRSAGSSTHDELLLEPIKNDFDREEWEW